MANFSHDCDKCIHLGSDNEYDFYFCKQHCLPTVIARFGNNPADYMSGMFAALAQEKIGNLDYPLVKALKLAREKNLVK